MSRIMCRYYMLPEYGEEEAFLAEQHRQGYALKRFIVPFFYIFEPCPAAQYTYKIDFQNLTRHEENAQYQQLYADYGWEYVASANGFHVFRKPSSEAEEDDIFSDNESRLAMVKRISKQRMGLLMMIVVLLFAYIGYKLVQAPTVLQWPEFYVLVLVALFDGYLCVRCWRGLRRLKRALIAEQR